MRPLPIRKKLKHVGDLTIPGPITELYLAQSLVHSSCSVNIELKEYIKKWLPEIKLNYTDGYFELDIFLMFSIYMRHIATHFHLYYFYSAFMDNMLFNFPNIPTKFQIRK